MARVQLITTGVMEERALGKSLGRLFPDHEFVSPPRLDGFTSAHLPPTPPLPSGVQLNLEKFVGKLIGAFDPGNRRDRSRPDFVIAVEDVELANADDPARITTSLRETLQRRLDAWPAKDRAHDRLREDLQRKVSFHLMAPMTESYFFADSASFTRATAPAPCRPSRFDPNTDVEAFAVDDPASTASRSMACAPSRGSTGDTSPANLPTPASRALYSLTSWTCSGLRVRRSIRYSSPVERTP